MESWDCGMTCGPIWNFPRRVLRDESSFTGLRRHTIMTWPTKLRQRRGLSGKIFSTSLCPRIHLGLSDRKKRNSSRGPHWKGKKTGVGGECKKKVIISCMCKTAMFLVLNLPPSAVRIPFPGWLRPTALIFRCISGLH